MKNRSSRTNQPIRSIKGIDKKKNLLTKKIRLRMNLKVRILVPFNSAKKVKIMRELRRQCQKWPIRAEGEGEAAAK